jgi:hypothetical protein
MALRAKSPPKKEQDIADLACRYGTLGVLRGIANFAKANGESPILGDANTQIVDWNAQLSRELDWLIELA